MYKKYNTLVEFCTNCIEIPKLLLAGIKNAIDCIKRLS